MRSFGVLRARRRVIAPVWAVAIALALAILAPGAAADAPKTQTVTKTVSVGVNPLGTYFDIACPKGYDAVAGSFVSQGTTVLGSSYKGFGQGVWTFNLRVRGGPSETVTLQVQCVALDLNRASVVGGVPGKFKQNVSMGIGNPVTTATAPGQSTQVDVKCPPGQTPVSPGVRTDSVATGEIRQQRVMPGGWRFEVYNPDFELLIMVLWVNCLDRKHAYKVAHGLRVLLTHIVIAETTARFVTAGASQFSSGCSPGRSLLTGGWVFPAGVALFMQMIYLDAVTNLFRVTNLGNQQASIETVDSCLQRKAKLK